MIKIVAALFLQTISIDGFVVDVETGTGVSNARIELRSTIGTAPATFITASAADGRFIFPGIKPGSYDLTGSRPGYVRLQPRRITVKSNQPASNIPLFLSPASAISGRVTDSRGEPVGNIVVQAEKASFKEGQRTMIAVKSTRTNDLGEYRLFWLPSGAYQLNVVPPPLGIGPYGNVATAVRNVATRPSSPKEDETYALSSPIELGPGADLTGVHISAAPSRRLSVRGILMDGDTRQPVTNESVQLFRVDRDRYTVAGTGATDDKGMFTISRVAAGSYTLFARMLESVVRLPVDVRTNDVDFMVSATRGFDVAGRVIVEGAPAPKLNLRVGLNLDPPAIVNWDFGNAMATLGGLIFEIPNSEVTSDGSFLLKNVPKGDFLVTVVDGNSSLQNVYVKSIRLGSSDVLNDGLHIDRQPNGPIEIVIGTKAGTVEGRVFDWNQQPMEGIRVILSPDAPGRPRADLHKAILTDVTGRFQLDGIAPGNYKLLALDDVEDGAWLDRDFLRLFDARSRSIQVMEGSKTRVDLPISRPGQPNR